MTLLERISDGLMLPEHYLVSLARSASHRYKVYMIPKRSGGLRTIEHPSRELKAVQRWLLRHVIEQLPVHPAAAAYRPGRGLRWNAEQHVSGRYLLRIDIHKFFPSITAADVDTFLRDAVPAYTPSDRGLFTSFVCRFGRLTIGAPTSPALSNAVCIQIDSRVHAECTKREVAYTRYADDMFFSTRAPNILRELPRVISAILRDVPYPTGLFINSSKTSHASRRGRRRVTGLILTPDGRVTIGRAMKRRIRALIHRYGTLSPEERRSLQGLLAFARGIEPDFLNALILKYGKPTIDRVRDFERRSEGASGAPTQS